MTTQVFSPRAGWLNESSFLQLPSKPPTLLGTKSDNNVSLANGYLYTI